MLCVSYKQQCELLARGSNVVRFQHSFRYDILNSFLYMSEEWNSAVGIATGYRLRGQSSSPNKGRIFLYFVQIGTGAHPMSCPMETGGSFPENKAAGV
jgi:hypothetical protein